MSKGTGKDQPLQVAIEGEELVIRIGFNALKMAAEYCPKFEPPDCMTDEPYLKIVDAKELADDVRRALQDEEEDGTTPLHKLFDEAIERARDDGSLAFSEDE